MCMCACVSACVYQKIITFELFKVKCSFQHNNYCFKQFNQLLKTIVFSNVNEHVNICSTKIKKQKLKIATATKNKRLEEKGQILKVNIK